MLQTIPRNLGAVPVALVLIVGGVACGSGSTTSSAGGGGGSITLTAQNISFQPSTLTVPASTQVSVTFENKDSVEHSFTFDDNSKSVDADGGSTQTLAFTSPSSGTTIAFHCKYHSSMHGSITVGSGGAGAGSSSSSTSSSSSSGY